MVLKATMMHEDAYYLKILLGVIMMEHECTYHDLDCYNIIDLLFDNILITNTQTHKHTICWYRHNVLT